MATPGTKRKKSSGGGPAAKKARLEDEDRKFFADGFDENCIGDEDDQEYLNGLTEVEREQVLAKRRDARDDDLDMQLFAERQQSTGGVQVQDDDDDDEEGDADEDEDEDSEEDTTEVGGKRLRRRSRRADDGSDSEESLTGVDTSGRVVTKGAGSEDEDSDFEQETRAERRKRKQREFAKKRGAGASSGAGGYDPEDEEGLLAFEEQLLDEDEGFDGTADMREQAIDHDEYDSDVEEEEKARRARLEKERQEPLTVRDVNQARLTRQFLLHFFLEPYFKDMIKGMFVRVLLGMDKDTSQRVYRLCRIKEVARGSTGYDVVVRGEKIKTFRRLVLYQGDPKDTKPFRVMLVSDQRATDEELQAFLHECRQSQVEPPTPADLRRRRRRAERVRKNHTYTTEDIEKMLAMKQASFDPRKVGNPTLYKIELEQRLQSLAESRKREMAKPIAAKEKILQEAGSEPAARRRAEQLELEAQQIGGKFDKQIALAKRHLEAIRGEMDQRAGKERTVSMRTASAINNRFRAANRKSEQNAAREQARLKKDAKYQHHVRNKAVGFIRRERKVEILWKIGAGDKGQDGEGGKEAKEADKGDVDGAAAAGGASDAEAEGGGAGGGTLLSKLGASPSRPSAARRGAGRGSVLETRAAVGGVDVDAALRQAIGGGASSLRAGASAGGVGSSSSSSSSASSGAAASGVATSASESKKPVLGFKAYLARKKQAAGGVG